MIVDWNSGHPFHASLMESSELILPCERAVSCCHLSVGNGHAKDGDACAKVTLIYRRMSLTLINVFRFIMFLFVSMLVGVSDSTARHTFAIPWRRRRHVDVPGVL